MDAWIGVLSVVCPGCLAVMCEFLHLNGEKVWINKKIELFKSEQETAIRVDVTALI